MSSYPMASKIRQIFFNALPVLIMVGLIPLVPNDYNLSMVYILYDLQNSVSRAILNRL